MKKISLFFAAISLSLSAMAATTFVFDSSDAVAQSADGISVALDKGAGNNPPAYYENGMRMYANNTITVSGANLTAIQIVFAKQGTKAYASLAVSEGNLVSGGESTSAEDLKTDSWTGNASSVVFTLGASGQRLIKQLVVNGDTTDILPPDTTGTVTPPTLDPEYVYAEPTIVNAEGETTGNNMTYSFIKNNIQVSCTKGAITETYFGCNAGFDLTFEATKAIKGIVINGYVKKDFDATTDKGNLTFVDASAEEVTADPVLVLTDVNANTVTISCVKQLRCYEVRVYFEANPTDSIEGGQSGTGEVVFLDFNAADAVFESEYSEVGNYNYTVYLYADTTEIPYIGLDLYTTELDKLEGVHELGEYSFYQFGEGDTDYTYNVEGQVAITKEGNIYTIAGYMTCENKNTYNFTFTGELPFYTDEEYYGGGEEEAIENVPAIDRNAPMFDILGRPVGKGYHGFVIQNGHKYLLQ